MSAGNKRLDIELPPVTGKAVPVFRGETLRITQVVGGQCVDFNCFNLHDYKEHMSVGHMRRQGLRLLEGHIVWSAPPRLSPMMYAVRVPPTCVTDLLAARCSAQMFELVFGLVPHTNCTDTFAEAIGEYGLTPDDIHDSLNMWMHTGLAPDGRTTYHWNHTVEGDHVDLLAMMDVLAVPIVCGSGDVYPTSNFSLKPISIQVFEASDKGTEKVEELDREYRSLATQKKLSDFRVGDIKTDRVLKAVPGYEPNFVNFPLEFSEVELSLTPEDLENLAHLRETLYPGTDEEVVLASVMTWYLHHRRNKQWDLYRSGVKV